MGGEERKTMYRDSINFVIIIKINDVDYPLSILSVDDGLITKIKLGDKIFVEQAPAAAVTEAAAPVIQKNDVVKTISPGLCRTWTPAEDQILRDNYPKYSIRRIFDKKILPNRTTGSIYDRSNRLQLRKYKTRKQKTAIGVKGNNVSLNFNHKILSKKYHNLVYEQCFNHLVFKLEQVDSFENSDLRKIIKDWYLNALNLEIKPGNLENYVFSYKSYGLDQGFFEKTGPGVFKIPMIAKNVEKVDAVGSDKVDGKVRGFTDHVKMRAKEIHDAEKLFLKQKQNQHGEG
jgi:hypothetical protein